MLTVPITHLPNTDSLKNSDKNSKRKQVTVELNPDYMFSAEDENNDNSEKKALVKKFLKDLIQKISGKN